MSSQTNIDQLRLLIFSDTHLSSVFEEKKFLALQKLIDDADLVIINGDFWDYYLTTWEDFLASKWNQLFPLLKSKKAIYIYGNHDLKEFSDERVHLFSDQQAEGVKLNLGTRKLNIQHGHLIVPSPELYFPFLRKKALVRLAQRFEESDLFYLGKRVMMKISQRNNNQIRKFAKNLEENEILICGHTHLAEYSVEGRYINTGVVKYGRAQGLMIKNGKLIVTNEKY